MDITRKKLRKYIQTQFPEMVSNQALLYLGIKDRSYWYRLRENNEIAFFKEPDGQIYYFKDSLLHWVDHYYVPKKKKVIKAKQTTAHHKKSVWKEIKKLFFRWRLRS